MKHQSNYINVSAHWGWCPFGMVFIRDCVYSGWRPFGMVSIRDCVHSGSSPFGIVSVRDRVQDPCFHSVCHFILRFDSISLEKNVYSGMFL